MRLKLLFIKAKKFGVKLTALRQNNGLSIETLSLWTGIPVEKITKIERGEDSATLPEIEILAMKMGLIPENLISSESESIPSKTLDPQLSIRYSSLRDRMIALFLRKARTDQGKTLEDVSKKCTIDLEEMERIEEGQTSIPLPLLDCLCSEYELPMIALLSQHGESPDASSPHPNGDALGKTIPADLVEFIQNPANQPYLELAKRLSELDAAKLRGIAEGLLEITY